MKISSIKQIASKYSIEELRDAEEALLNENRPSVDIEGEDEGEQLTHVLAALFVKEYMEKEGSDINRAIREYSLKVRKSIS